MVAHSRRQERGAAIFIVVMVIALLTAIGMFAAHSASQTDAAAGFDRRSVQTLGLAEYAGRAAVAQIGSSPATYIRLIGTSPDKCQVNELLDPTRLGTGITRAGCYNIYSEEIAANLATGAILTPQTDTQPGSLGPALAGSGFTQQLSSALDGVFKVELTDAYQQLPPARWDAAANQYRAYKITLTAFAQIRNVPLAPVTNSWCSATTTSPGANVQAVRAFITAMSN